MSYQHLEQQIITSALYIPEAQDREVQKIADLIATFQQVIVGTLRNAGMRKHHLLDREKENVLREQDPDLTELWRYFSSLYSVTGVSTAWREWAMLQLYETIGSTDTNAKTLKDTLCSLYDQPSFDDKKKRHLSFATKMVSLKDQSFPIYDANVAALFPIMDTWKDQLSHDLSNIDTWLHPYISNVEQLQQDLLQEQQIQDMIQQVRAKVLGITLAISDERVLDYVLWALGGQMLQIKKVDWNATAPKQEWHNYPELAPLLQLPVPELHRYLEALYDVAETAVYNSEEVQKQSERVLHYYAHELEVLNPAQFQKLLPQLKKAGQVLKKHCKAQKAVLDQTLCLNDLKATYERGATPL